MENVGGVDEARRPAFSNAVYRAAQHYESILATGAPPKRKAVQLLPLSLVSLELEVIDENLQHFMRVYAWASSWKCGAPCGRTVFKALH